MACPPVDVLLAAVHDRASAEVDAHVRGCAACRMVIEMADAQRSVAAAPPEDCEALAPLLARRERLDGAARARVEEHLVRCAACREVVAFLDEPDDVRPDGSLRRVEPGVYVRGKEVERTEVARISEAWDQALGRPVLLWEPLGDDQRARFERQARLLSALQHTGIPTILDAGTWSDGHPFLATRPLLGKTLEQAIAPTRRLAERLALLPRLAAAVETVASAHARHIVHGRLDPSRILLDDFGETTVVGWGHAVRLDDPASDTVEPASKARGTPYTAPEQALGELPAQSADVYSLGAILHCLVAGMPPPAERLPLPDVPAPLTAIIDKAMARDPDSRHADARQLADDLQRFVTRELARSADQSYGPLSPGGLGRSRAPLAVLAASIVVGIVAGALALDRARRRAEEARDAVAVRLDDQFLESARRELLAGEPLRALAYLTASPGEAADPSFRYLARAALRPVDAVEHVLVGHTAPVVGAWYSPDGALILTASRDGDARLWNAVSGAPLVDLGDHVQAVRDAAFSSDGQRIVTGSEDGTIRLWGMPRGDLLATWRSSDGAAVLQVAFAGDGAHVAARSSGGALRLWEVASGHSIPVADVGHCTAVARNPRSGELDAIFDGQRLVVVDAVTAVVRSPRQLPMSVRSLAYSADGSHFAMTADRDVLVADPGLPAVAILATGSVLSAELSPDGSMVVTSGADGVVRVWDTQTALLLADFGGHRGPVHSARFSPDGMHLASASDDGTGRVWNAQDRAILAVIRAEARPILGVRFDGARVITLSDDATVAWDARSGKQVGSGPPTLPSLAGSRDGAQLVVSATGGWEIRSASHATPLRGAIGQIRCASWSPDSMTLATGAEDGTVQLWEGATGKELSHFADGTASVTALAFSADGNQLLAGASDGRVRIWAPAEARLIAVMDAHSGAVVGVAYEQAGWRFASAGLDGAGEVWDVRGRLLARFELPAPATVTGFAPEGTEVAFGTRDGTLVLADVGADARPPSVISTLAERGTPWHLREGILVEEISAASPPRSTP